MHEITNTVSNVNPTISDYRSAVLNGSFLLRSFNNKSSGSDLIGTALRQCIAVLGCCNLVTFRAELLEAGEEESVAYTQISCDLGCWDSEEQSVLQSAPKTSVFARQNMRSYALFFWRISRSFVRILYEWTHDQSPMCVPIDATIFLGILRPNFPPYLSFLVPGFIEDVSNSNFSEY